MNVIISAIRHSGAGIRIFELRACRGDSLPSYQAGAHIDVTLGNGLTRQYSLCCDRPSPECYRIAVKQEPQSRGGSAWLHADAKEGDMLQIGVPRNAFALSDAAGSHLLFAGGIGITPVLSMAYALLRDGGAFHLHYFVRDEESIAFRDELTASALASCVSIHAGLSPEQTASVISSALAHAAADTHAYTCGPGPFMAAVVELASARLGAAQVHKESFSAPVADAGDKAFVIRLRDRREIEVAADQTALACLQAAGVDVDCSCEVGVCGTCRTKVIEGVPDHRDGFLSEEEKASNVWFMPCVSRAWSGVLVLDL
ncbi:PDR/VanB family oxidoreductase [Herbaspirillum rhizosphaerae]|uniref:PDR/VanB family oxidoreductase n=1 Tax=Herbaspirillum rhizosphaerae TaxID=346179 RepID=UPI00067B5B35|nr:PDR/VanB family oxidoreductase [Herbaspirillum rhizosphaerae]